MNKLNVAVTGYYGTGSSAVVDFLKEFNCCNIAAPANKDYEHVIFYSNGGLFDLGAIVQNSYSPYTFDYSVNNFIKCTQKLNDNDFGWFGSYKKMFDNRFSRISNDFINSIANTKSGRNTSHVVKVKYTPIKALLQIGANVIWGRPINKFGRVYVYDKNKMYSLNVNNEDFVSAVRKYTSEYCELFRNDKDICIFDHLIWPQQCKLVDEYFDDNFKMIIVKRDPRDVFNLNKYYWSKPPVGHGTPFFPTEVDAFAEEWRLLNIQDINTTKVLTVSFDSLVYNYEEEVARIIYFLGLSPEQHVNKGKYFDPNKSIDNTQTYLLDKTSSTEASMIEELLNDYTFKYPYAREPIRNNWFDTQGTTPKK